MTIKIITTLKNIIFWIAISFYVLAAYVMRQSGLNPNSLWLDDQWVATLIKTETWIDILTIHAPVPVGFLIIIKFFHSIINDPELSLQIFPFLCGLIQIPIIAILGKQLSKRHSIGLIMAFFLVFSPEISTYSLRVKSYTLDSLITICLILAQVSWLKNNNFIHYSRFCIISSVAIFFSFTSVLVSFILINISVVLNYIKRKNTNNIFIYTIGYNIFIFLSYYFLLRHQSNPMTKEYWAMEFINLKEYNPFIAFINNNFLSIFTNSIHPDLNYLLALFPIGLICLILNKYTRNIGIFVIAYYFVFLALSGLQIYPMGGVRTDIFSYPVVIITIGLGCNMLIIRCSEFLVKIVRRGGNVISMIQLNNFLKFTDVIFLLTVILCSSWFISTKISDRYSYVSNEDKKAVLYLNDNLPDNSGLIIYPHAMWAMGYYGKWEYDNIFGLKNNVGVGHNFDTHLKRDNTLNFSTLIGGISFEKNIKIYTDIINTFLENELDNIFLIITSPSGIILNPILSAIDVYNYKIVEVVQFHPHSIIRHYRRN